MQEGLLTLACHITQSGAILRSPIPTSGTVPPMLPPSSSSNRVAISTMRSVSHSSPLRLLYLRVSFGSDSGGAMCLYTRLLRPYLEKRTRSTFARDRVQTSPVHIVLQRRTGQGRCTCDPAQNFGVSHRCFDWLTSPVVDYDGYSCLWRWNQMNVIVMD